MSFVFLNNKSGYTFLKSTLKIRDLVNHAKANNMDFLALTDRNNMFGAMEFVHECKKNNIRPIVGMEVVLDETETPIILLASGNEGYLNLCKLTRFVTTPSLKSLVSLDTLSRYNNGLIAIVPFIRSNLFELEFEKKCEFFDKIKSIYTSVYLGLEYYGSKDNSKLSMARSFATSYNLKSVPIFEVLSDSYQNANLINVLKAIDENVSINEIEKIDFENHYFLSDYYIKDIFNENEISQTRKIASICEYHFEKIKGDLVKYPLDANINDYDYLYALAHKGLSKRLNNHVSSVYKDRLNYELSIIKKMNFVNYFLVVYDYVQFAKRNGILVGPGRGSAGGCLVAYAIGITNVDPIKYNLLFERFLNPERITMPDIDVDFIDTKRERVFEYLEHKYGQERCCRVVTFSTLTSKACLRDVSKALGCSINESKELSKKLSDIREESFEKLVKNSPSFLSAIKTNEKYKLIYDTCLKLENLPRQVGTHAAGVVVCENEISSIVPVYSNESYLSTQYDLSYLEEFDLFKMDILGLTNLSILEECQNKVKQLYNVDVKLSEINYDDPNIFTFFQKGQYAGIFQFDKNSISHASNQIKPDSLLEVACVNALGRPGPMEFVPTYAARKFKKSVVRYIDPSLEPILKETYGIIVYQEQIIQILCKMAGFSMGKADVVRRAISKKDATKLVECREDFVKGCQNNGYKIEEAIKVFDDIERFASYGFNKSHSIAYGMISLQLAHFKYYYPSIFYASILNIYFEKEKFAKTVFEMKQNGVSLLNPNINLASYEFVTKGKDIVYSLSLINGLKPQIIKAILDEREKSLYIDFIDFVVRTKFYGLEEEDYLALIEAGCFDDFDLNRTTLKFNLVNILMYASIAARKIDDTLIIDQSTSKPIIRKYDEDFDYESSKESFRLGLYLSKHPLSGVREMINTKGFILISNVKANTQAKVLGKITYIKTIENKKGEKMAFVEIEDESGIIECVFFAEKYFLYKSILTKENYIQVLGKVNLRNDELTINVDRAKTYELERTK